MRSSRIGLILHSPHNADNFPSVCTNCEQMAHRVPRGAKPVCESLIDNRNLGARENLPFCEFAAIQNPSPHGLEISRQDRDHRRIAFSWTSIQSKWSPDERRRVERKEFGGTRGENPWGPADAAKYLLKIRELPPLHLVGRA